MDTVELKKMVNTYVDDIDKRLSTIESNTRKRNGWATLYDSIKKAPHRTDANILLEMTQTFGENCLKALITSVAENFVKEFDEKITAQSCDLKMIIKPKQGS
jgi:hypothetical protein